MLTEIFHLGIHSFCYLTLLDAPYHDILKRIKQLSLGARLINMQSLTAAG